MNKSFFTSFAGSDKCVAKYNDLLVESLRETCIWRRSNSQHTGPVRLPIELVAYKPQLILPTLDDRADYKTCFNCALLHLYFVDCQDVDEYRLTTRSELVEWFAALRDRKSVDWLIVFDSARSRQLKTRTALTDKLRSDFSKYTNKLVEVDTTTITKTSLALVKVSRELLLARIDALLMMFEQQLQSDRINHRRLDWHFLQYVDNRLCLTQVYGNLGLIDQVLAQHDELEAFHSLIVSEVLAGSLDRPQWLERCATRVCHSLPSLLVFVNTVDVSPVVVDVSYLELRLLLLSRQVVALHWLERGTIRTKMPIVALRDVARKRSLGGSATDGGGRWKPTTGTDATVSEEQRQLDAYFCSATLRYCCRFLAAVDEESAVLRIEMKPDELSCWRVLFCLEVFHLCSRFCDPVQIESAASNTCRLWICLCNAMGSLGRELGRGSGTTVSSSAEAAKLDRLSEWLQQMPPMGDSEPAVDDLHPVAKVNQLIASAESFAHYMQKFHEGAMAVLKHFKWKRHSRLLGMQLADFLISSDRTEGALPYYLKVLNSLGKEKWSDAYVWLLQSVVTHFETKPDLYQEQLIEFYCNLAVGSRQSLLKQKYFDRLMMALREKKTCTPYRLDECRQPMTVVQVDEAAMNWKTFPTRAYPGEQLTFTLLLHSSFPSSVESASVRLCFLDKEPTLSNDDTLRFYTTRRSEKETEAYKLTSSTRLTAPRASDATPPQFCPGTFVMTSSLMALRSGHNEVEVTGIVSASGCFQPDHVDVIIGALTLSLRPGTLAGALALRVEETERWVELKTTEANHPLGGLSQRYELVCGSGTEDVVKTTEITINGVEGNPVLQFQKRNETSWHSQLCVTLPTLKPLNEHSISFAICCVLDHLRSDATFKTKLRVDWSGRSYVFEIFFAPVLYLATTTVMCEDYEYLVCGVHRCWGDMSVRSQGASLSVQSVTPSSDDGQSPPLTAALTTTPQLIGEEQLIKADLLPKSCHSLVWRLARRKQLALTDDDSGEPIEYKLELTYTYPGERQPRDYIYTDRLLIYNEAANYELCCQISSASRLCRVDAECDLIVSLRSLKTEQRSRAETVFVTLDAATQFWHLPERQQVLSIKESGLGQVAFSIVPKMVGHLPYPKVSLYRSVGGDGVVSAPLPLRLYVRTSGKQVHVLKASTAQLI